MKEEKTGNEKGTRGDLFLLLIGLYLSFNKKFISL